MGRPMRKKGESGAATSYISRQQALKKLQLSLKDFRRLCIIKGIYPVEPKHKKKANKNNSTNKTYYYLKDINFLSHEPLINKFREFRIFIRRLTRAIGRKDQETSHRLRENEPIFTLDHVIKERYPTLVDALRDLDDAVSMCFLFSTFPKIRRIKVELIDLCRRVTVEFMNYVIASRSLRKVFFSIKGVYYQAEIKGQLVTWVVPHAFGYKHPTTDVDFKIMVTFTDFYSTMLGFVNCHLYHSLNLIYPPKLCVETPDDQKLLEGEENSIEVVASLNQKLMTASENSIDDAEIDEFPELEDSEALTEYRLEQEKVKKQQKLFEGCKIFINREVPRESLVFVIRTFGGEVSYDKTLFPGSTFDETDHTITHQIIDRPVMKEQYVNRYYVQPQWVYDCVNACMLLPVESYFIGAALPPHLSPFVQEKEGDYIPPERQALINIQRGLTSGVQQTETDSEEEQIETDNEEEEDVLDSGVEDETPTVKECVKRKSAEDESDEPRRAKMKVTPGSMRKDNAVLAAERLKAEEKRLAIMMIPKKKKHLYDKIVYGQKRKNREATKLKAKREEYDKIQKKLKKSKIKTMS